MSIIKWEPFGDFDRFFENWPRLSDVKIGGDLAVDLYEDGHNLVATMQLPGVKSDEIEVSVEDHYLKVSGSRKDETEEKKKDYYAKEIRRGSFERVLRLPKPVLANGVKADYKDGVLKVTLPIDSGIKSSGVRVKVSGS